jgi:hypothetical protein
VFFFCKIEFVIKTHCCKVCTFCRCALHSPANTFFGFKVLKIEMRIRFDGALDLRKYDTSNIYMLVGNSDLLTQDIFSISLSAQGIT